MPPGAPVRLIVPSMQTGLLLVAAGVGNALTVTVAEAVFLHPFTSVTVTV